MIPLFLFSADCWSSTTHAVNGQICDLANCLNIQTVRITFIAHDRHLLDALL